MALSLDIKIGGSLWSAHAKLHAIERELPVLYQSCYKTHPSRFIT